MSTHVIKIVYSMRAWRGNNCKLCEVPLVGKYIETFDDGQNEYNEECFIGLDVGFSTYNEVRVINVHCPQCGIVYNHKHEKYD